MEKLKADFVQFSSAFANFFGLDGRLGTRSYCTLFETFLKFTHLNV